MLPKWWFKKVCFINWSFLAVLGPTLVILGQMFIVKEEFLAQISKSIMSSGIHFDFFIKTMTPVCQTSKHLCEWTDQVEVWRKWRKSHKKQWSECSLVRIEINLCSFVYMLVSQNVLTVNKVWVIICGASLPTPVTAMFVTSIDLSSVSLGLWSSVVTHFKLGEGSRTPDFTETFR